MSEDNIKVDTQVIDQLASVADTLGGLLEKVSERHDNQSKDMDYFREDLALVRDSIRNIAKVLHEGNGEKPLISRVAVLEEKASNLEEQFDKLELRLEEGKSSSEKKINTDKKGKYAISAAIITGIGGLVVELVRWFG